MRMLILPISGINHIIYAADHSVDTKIGRMDGIGGIWGTLRIIRTEPEF